MVATMKCLSEDKSYMGEAQSHGGADSTHPKDTAKKSSNSNSSSSGHGIIRAWNQSSFLTAEKVWKLRPFCGVISLGISVWQNENGAIWFGNNNNNNNNKAGGGEDSPLSDSELISGENTSNSLLQPCVIYACWEEYKDSVSRPCVCWQVASW
jgi:hypothetical protein